MKLQHTSLSFAALLLCAQGASAEIVLAATPAKAQRGSVASLDFTVHRRGETGAAVSFSYRTRDGSARAGRDYTAVQGTATIPAGQTQTVVSVPVSATGGGDRAVKFELLLGSPAVAGIDPNVLGFSGAGAFGVGSFTEGSAVGDFNGDGRLDVAFSGSGVVTVLANATGPGAAQGRFTKAAQIGAGQGRLRAADLNRDGRPDLVVAHNGTNRLDVLMNTTPPGATTSFTFALTSMLTVDYGWTSDIAFADFDADGIIDVVAANPGSTQNEGTGRALVYRNTTPQGAQVPVLTLVAQLPASTSGSPLPRSVAAADFNGDGKPDIAIDSAGVGVLLNTTPAGASLPTFAGVVTFPGITGANEMAVADFDRDGLPDIVTANSDGWAGFTWSVLRNGTAQGAGVPSFKRTEFISGAPYGVAAADVDADGFPDVVLTNLAGDASNGGTIEVHRNLGKTGGAPSFSTVVSTPAGDEPHTVSVGDFNRDGWLDYVGLDWLGNSAGFEFQRPALQQPRLARASATGTLLP
ncbi:MAG TPA: FG-GAP-like repeat-containing protein [Ideonella sp.]|nr:FG-GAP-like repeat-containing protein [Ideonella sp.]